MDYIQAFSAFFGTTPNTLGNTIIITNINPIFHGLVEQSILDYPVFKGFYELTKVRYDTGNTYDLLKISAGNNIIDVLKLVINYVDKVIFVGIAGSLISDYSIGEVYSPSEFIDRIIPSCKYQHAICQTSGLIQSDEFYLDLKKAGVALVDMECFDVYTLCNNNKISLKYIVQVSDKPLECPFYAAKPENIKVKDILNIIKTF